MIRVTLPSQAKLDGTLGCGLYRVESTPRHVVGFRPHPCDQPVRAWQTESPGRRDYPQGSSPRVEEVVSLLAHTGAKAIPCLLGGWGGKSSRSSTNDPRLLLKTLPGLR